MSKPNFLNSTIFLKWVMALTGALLVLFVIGHLAGNLQVFLGPESFNTYSHFLQSTGELLWIVRIVLLTAVLLHIFTSLKLTAINNAANPIKYRKSGYKKSTIYSRTMIYTGLMILAFIVFHLLHYTARTTEPAYNGPEYHEIYGTQVKGESLEIAIDENTKLSADNNYVGIQMRHDTYKMVLHGFSNPAIVIVYLIGVILLGMHLTHAIQSMFQTLNIAGPNLSPKILAFSKWFGWLITLLYASIPLSVLLGIIGGGQ